MNEALATKSEPKKTETKPIHQIEETRPQQNFISPAESSTKSMDDSKPP